MEKYMIKHGMMAVKTRNDKNIYHIKKKTVHSNKKLHGRKKEYNIDAVSYTHLTLPTKRIV